MVRFREEMSPDHLGKRVIISNLLETTNALYPKRTAFKRKLSELYGANFATGVAKKGKQHLLSIDMSVVNPKFVEMDVLQAAVQFLQAAIFQPDCIDSAFNPEIFEREQINLIHYLEAMNEDRAYYASHKLSALYFTDDTLSLPSVATPALIAAQNPKDVFRYYQEMLQNNAIDIFVLGDVDETQIIELFSTFAFSDRSPQNDIFYQQEIQNDVTDLSEEKEATQSILQLAYHLPVAYGDADYLALQIMNGLLGGFAHSKLFTNVREKASLAYSISSAFDSFAGFFKIAAGIDAENDTKARKLIFEQVKALQAGNFSEAELEQTKKVLRNTFFVSQDSASNLIEMEFVKSLVPDRYLEQTAFLTALSKVTKADVQRVAQDLTLQTEYFMRGKS